VTERGLARFAREHASVLRLLLGGVIISFSAVFVKLTDVGPTASGVYRNLFGGLALLLVALVRRESLWRGWKPLSWAILAALFFAADIFCWHRSILYIGPGLATIIGNFQVFVLAFVGIIIFREKASWRFLVSIPSAVIGLFLLVGIDWQTLDASYRIGVGFGLLTALCYTGYLLTLRYSGRSAIRLSATVNLALVSLLTALLLVPVAIGAGESLRIPDAYNWLILASYGVSCQAVGWVIIFGALARVDASRAGLLLLVQPTLTFAWDILFFARPTTLIEALGAILALGAIYLGNTRRREGRER